MPRKSYRVSFPGGNGFQLAGIVDRPSDRPSDRPDGQPDGEPNPSQRPPCLVFSHCFTCNKDLKAIVRISRALAESGIAVLRFDMTGLGGSDGDFSLTNFSTNQSDLKSAIAFAESELGPVATLMGHSFGGAASLAVASEMDSLSSVVTLAAPSDTVHLAHLLSRMNPEIEKAGQGTVTIGGIDWQIRREMLEDFRTHDLPEKISRINARVLIFHSPTDATVGYDHALRIAGLIQGSESATSPASLVTLHDADHLLASRNEDLIYVANSTAAFVHRYA